MKMIASGSSSVGMSCQIKFNLVGFVRSGYSPVWIPTPYGLAALTEVKLVPRPLNEVTLTGLFECSVVMGTS